MELVDCDLCGPMKTIIVAGARYFLLFVDDFFRKMWVYFLKKKSDAFCEFQNFKATLENESRRRIRTLKLDNGSEFSSNVFESFCEKEGIQGQFTPPYTPHQNGVVERRNQTVIKMARCLLQGKSVPNKYWEEAMHTVVYLLNKCPSKVVEDITPEEKWSSKKP